MEFLENILGHKSMIMMFLSRFSSIPSLAARGDTVTISGQSSGSLMSNQMHIIMSDTFKGAGMMEGGSYWTIDYFLDPDLAAEVDVDTVVAGSINKA